MTYRYQTVFNSLSVAMFLMGPGDSILARFSDTVFAIIFVLVVVFVVDWLSQRFRAQGTEMYCRCSSMVELLLPKQAARVRFPSSAPIERHSGYKDFRPGRGVSGVAFLLFWCGFRGVRVGRVVPLRNL